MRLVNMKWSPASYEEAAVIAREAGLDLLSRLDWMTIHPAVVLDMGCGVGEASIALQKRYQHASVIALDLSWEMIRSAHHRGASSVCADGGFMPFKNNSIDIIFANFLLPWQQDFTLFLTEWRRVLRPNGLLLFTALGKDTLKESQSLLDPSHIPKLVDMHDVGDSLLQHGFVDPVLDVSHYQLVYDNKEKLIAELRASGLWFPEDVEVSQKIVCEEEWKVSYEVIYAHAFVPLAGKTQQINSKGEISVPLAQIRSK